MESSGDAVLSAGDEQVSDSVYGMTSGLVPEELDAVDERFNVLSTLINRQMDPSSIKKSKGHLLKAVFNRALSNKNFDIKKSETKVDSLSRICDRRLAKLKDQEQDLTDLQTDFDKLLKNNFELNDKIFSLHLEVIDVKKELNEEMSRNNKMDTDLQAKDLEIERLEVKAKEEHRLRLMVNKSRSLTKLENGILKNEVASAKEELDESKNNINNLEAEIANIKSDNSNQVNALKAEITNIKSDNSNQVNALKAELAKIKSDNSNQVNALKTELESEKSIMHSLKQMISSNEAELANASKTISILKSNISNVQQTGNSTGQDLLTEQGLLLREKIDTIDNLRLIIETKEYELKDSYDKVANLKSELNDKDLELDYYKSTLDEKASEQNKNLDEIDNFKLLLDVSKEENEHLMAKSLDLLSKLGEKIDDKTDRIELMAIINNTLRDVNVVTDDKTIATDGKTIPASFKMTFVLDKIIKNTFKVFKKAPKKFYSTKNGTSIISLLGEPKYIKIARKCLICDKVFKPSRMQTENFYRGVETDMHGESPRYDIVCWDCPGSSSVFRIV